MITRRLKCEEITTRDRGPGNAISRHASLDVDGVKFALVLTTDEHASLAHAFVSGERLLLTIAVEPPEVP